MAYVLFTCSVCDVQCRCSCSCRLWRYISVTTLPLPLLLLIIIPGQYLKCYNLRQSHIWEFTHVSWRKVSQCQVAANSQAKLQIGPLSPPAGCYRPKEIFLITWPRVQKYSRVQKVPNKIVRDRNCQLQWPEQLHVQQHSDCKDGNEWKDVCTTQLKHLQQSSQTANKNRLNAARETRFTNEINNALAWLHLNTAALIQQLH